MNNAERSARLLMIARKALETVWPEKVEVDEDVSTHSGEPRYKIILHMDQAAEKTVPQVLRDCTIPELFQYVAGIAKDYRPDFHYVFDTKSKKFCLIDTVDHTEAELVERFVPFEPPDKDERYERIERDGKDVILHRTPNGTTEITLP